MLAMPLAITGAGGGGSDGGPGEVAGAAAQRACREGEALQPKQCAKALLLHDILIHPAGHSHIKHGNVIQNVSACHSEVVAV